MMKGLSAEEPKMSLTSMASGVIDNIYCTVVFGRRAVKRSRGILEVQLWSYDRSWLHSVEYNGQSPEGETL